MAVIRCGQGHYYDDEKFSQCPFCGIFVNAQHNPALQNTVFMENTAPNPSDDQKTIGYYSGIRGNDFVTGWLVCVEGPERGRDYRLSHGFNRIGRDYNMPVCIVDDPQISQENHCSVVYDERSNTFSLVPSGGNLTYLGDELVSHPVRLKTGDIIRIGASSFEFVAFCREGRIWEKEQ